MKFSTHFINFHHFMMNRILKNNNNKRHKNIHQNVNIEGGPPAKAKTKKRKKRRRNKCDLGDDFESPDAGWAWVLFVASTIHIWLTFALAENFSAIHEQHMNELGITSAQSGKLMSTQAVIAFSSGLINAPFFRRFSFRQVALMSSSLTFLGFFLCLFASSYTTYLICFSVIFGFGYGLTISATTVAIVTYFFRLRRTVTAHQFGMVALGSIGFSYFSTFLTKSYGVQGAVLIISGMSLNNIACSLIYQPVMWHVKKFDNSKRVKKISEEPLKHTEEVKKAKQATINTISDIVDLHGARYKVNEQCIKYNLHDDHYGTYKMLELSNISHHHEDCQTSIQLPQERDRNTSSIDLTNPEKHSLLYRIFIFMEFDLLLDFTYVNLAIGMTIVYYDEMNFSPWMPDILADFGFPNYQVNLAISVLNWTDIAVRFLIPFITSYDVSNKTYFLMGTIGLSIGRIVLSCMNGYYGMLVVCVWLGLCKAFRYIHWFIIITDHLPLKRLPAGLGLQFVMTCVFSAAFEPFIAFIRDHTNYTVTLNFMSGLGLLVSLSWILEDLWRKFYRESKTKSENS